MKFLPLAASLVVAFSSQVAFAQSKVPDLTGGLGSTMEGNPAPVQLPAPAPAQCTATCAQEAPKPAKKQVIKKKSSKAEQPKPTSMESAVVPKKIEPVIAAINGHLARAGGIVVENGVVKFPFGMVEPVIVCAPLRICTVELQAGEKLLNAALGDATRWNITPAVTGETTLVVIKPLISNLDDPISTNLLLTTDRRAYTLTLKTDKEDFVPRAAFYYPQDTVQTFMTRQQAESLNQSSNIAKEVESNSRKVDADKVAYDYQIEGDSEFKPTRVFDDGKQLFIQLPAGFNQAPAVLVDGEIVNYRVSDGFYIVDRIGKKTSMIIGVGRNQRRVDITKGKGFFNSVFGN